MNYATASKDSKHLVNQGERFHHLNMQDGTLRGARVQVTKVRQPLMTVAGMNDAGQIVHFLASGESFAVHRESGMVTKFIRSKGVFEIDAAVPPYRLDPEKVLCQEVRPTKREHGAEVGPVEMPMEGMETSGDVWGSSTVPEVEVEQDVGFESEEPVNELPSRASWEPTKAEKDVHEMSGHAPFRPWCRSLLAGAGREREIACALNGRTNMPSLVMRRTGLL